MLEDGAIYNEVILHIICCILIYPFISALPEARMSLKHVASLTFMKCTTCEVCLHYKYVFFVC